MTLRSPPEVSQSSAKYFYSFLGCIELLIVGKLLALIVQKGNAKVSSYRWRILKILVITFISICK